MSEELKPCPYCGKAAGRMGEWAFCPDDMCPVGGRGHRLSDWNCRAVDEAGVERVARFFLERSCLDPEDEDDVEQARNDAREAVEVYLGLEEE